MTDDYGENTRAVHLPPPPALDSEALALPVIRSSTFAFESAQEYADVLGGRQPGFSYTRIDNPTAAAFASAVASLEGARCDGDIAAEAFGSGMAAITAVLMSLTHAGAHVVAPAACYGGTFSLLRGVLSRFGVETTFVPGNDAADFGAACRPDTALVWAETIANPTLAVADLPALADIARGVGAVFVVDSTFASPAVCRPLEHGADVVVHAATKYIGGHSDATGGVVVGKPDVLAKVRAVRMETGAILAPDDAFLLHRGLATLPLRVARQCATAREFAETIAKHPRVEKLLYPGLADHPDHERAGRLFDAGRYGACVTVTPEGGREAGMVLCDRLRLARIAPSLGGHHTIVSHAASTTHRQLDDAELTAADIDPGAVRFSIGLEDAADLIADAVQALDNLDSATSA
ncbi:MAG: trans-sulfuration enzyme family protein [Actinomycetes bacterium]